MNDQPLLFSLTLMENLKFGNQKPHTDEEIWECCRAVGLSEPLIGNADVKVGNRGLKLSVSDRIIVGIVRALLSSVDLLLISNSMDMLGIKESEFILNLLRKWIDNRGMPFLSADNPPGVITALKKRKTVFYITKNKELESLADTSIKLSRDSIAISPATSPSLRPSVPPTAALLQDQAINHIEGK